MKSFLFSLALLGSSLLVYATDERFTKAMEASLEGLKTAKTPTDVQAVANQLERIAAAEPKEWLAPYWAAYAYTTLAWMAQEQPAKMDPYLEKAEALLASAEKIGGTNDETVTLAAYVAQARLVVDAQNRWQTYGAKATEALAKARKMNPANPRPYFLEGQALLYTPEAVGGGKAKACPLLQQAAEKYAAFQPASSISPNWGNDRLVGLLSQCAN